jgi:TetR/AcrR family transcriptional regulator, transcriptional repressor for nem operon
MEPLPDRKARSHERIVDAAARAIRRDGYAGVGVADVMREAGLTHGGFYAHFPSRDALIVAALERAARTSTDAARARVDALRARGLSRFRVLVESYLHDSLLKTHDAGCPVAALGSEMPRQAGDVRKASVARVRSLVRLVERSLPDDTPMEQAGVVAATLVGSLQLARALGATAEGRALLAASRSALIAQFDPD